MSARFPVGILGATGTVGQEFIAALAAHPWFEVTWIAASERSAGKAYADATPWRLPSPRPDEFAGMVVRRCTPEDAPALVFSGLDASAAGRWRRRSPRPGTRSSAMPGTTAWRPTFRC